jgi:hypothetical protein
MKPGDGGLKAAQECPIEHLEAALEWIDVLEGRSHFRDCPQQPQELAEAVFEAGPREVAMFRLAAGFKGQRLAMEVSRVDRERRGVPQTRWGD